MRGMAVRAYGRMTFRALPNGGVYSRDLGMVTLPDGPDLNPDPTTGEYAVAKLNGYVFTHAGDTPRPGRAILHLWGNTRRVTTTGVEIQGFASTSNIEGGYYSSGWLYPGKYLCILIDNGTEPKKVKQFEVELLRPFERLDFTLETIFDS